MTQFAILHLEHPDLVGWEPRHAYEIPASWVLRVAGTKLYPGGGRFDDRSLLIVSTERRTPSGDKWEPGPHFDFVLKAPGEHRELPELLAYLMSQCGSDDLSAVADARSAGGTNPNKSIPGEDGHGFTTNELLLAGLVQGHLAVFEAALLEVLAGSGPAGALGYAELAVRQAYQLGRIARERELKAAYEALAERGEVDLKTKVELGKTTGGKAATKADKWRNPLLAKASELRSQNRLLGQDPLVDMLLAYADANNLKHPKFERVRRQVSEWEKKGDLTRSDLNPVARRS